jgi:hypothetical protein
MPRISKHGGAGMIGGVRSPMATPAYGLVTKKPVMHPAGTSATRRGALTGAPPVQSPMDQNKLVK